MALYKPIFVLATMVLSLVATSALAQEATQDEKVPNERVRECQVLATTVLTSVRAKKLTLEVRNRVDTLAATLQVQCAIGRFGEAAKIVEAMRGQLGR